MNRCLINRGVWITIPYVLSLAKGFHRVFEVAKANVLPRHTAGSLGMLLPCFCRHPRVWLALVSTTDPEVSRLQFWVRTWLIFWSPVTYMVDFLGTSWNPLWETLTNLDDLHRALLPTHTLLNLGGMSESLVMLKGLWVVYELWFGCFQK